MQVWESAPKKVSPGRTRSSWIISWWQMPVPASYSVLPVSRTNSRIRSWRRAMRSLGAGAAWSMTRKVRAGFHGAFPPISRKALMASGAVVSVSIAASTSTIARSPACRALPAWRERIFSVTV